MARDAVRYNDEWLIEENGYLSPLDARAARLNTTLQRAASSNRVSRKPDAVLGFQSNWQASPGDEAEPLIVTARHQKRGRW